MPQNRKILRQAALSGQVSLSSGACCSGAHLGWFELDWQGKASALAGKVEARDNNA
jgi:hypothetical protein